MFYVLYMYITLTIYNNIYRYRIYIYINIDIVAGGFFRSIRENITVVLVIFQ